MEATAKRRALGRGLGALIPSDYREETVSDQPLTVALASIRPNPFQPRQAFADDRIEELANSIRQKGILQPLLVRRANGGFELIAGERRFRAAQRAGLAEVPVAIRDVDDSELLEIALIENIQRENLNPLEEARAYRRLMDEFHLTQEQVATRVAKDRSTVANTVRLLQLPEEIQTAIENGTLSAGHARALLAAGSDEQRLTLAREVLSSKLNVRQTEQKAKISSRAPVASDDADHKAAEQRLTEALGTKVRLLSRKGGGGKIEIEYYSLAELNGLIRRLAG